MRSPYRRTTATAVVALVAAVLSPSRLALADTYVLDTRTNPFVAGSANHGWYDNLGFHNPNNDNYMTYAFDDGEGLSYVLRNFFSFDLSQIDLSEQTVVSASLQVQRFSSDSPTGSVRYGLFDVASPASLLNGAISATQGLSIFDDLGSGKTYGAFDVATPGAPDDVLEFALNPDALADITGAADGWFLVGGTLLNPQQANGGFLFGSSGRLDVDPGNPGRPPALNRLVLVTTRSSFVIPEAGTLPLMAAAAAGTLCPFLGRVAGRRRRRRA